MATRQKPEKCSLRYFIAHERWEEAYYHLLNTPNPGRYLSGGGKPKLVGRNLLVEVCVRPAPPRLVDLVASFFPQDIVGRRALHHAIVSRRRRITAQRNDTRAETVKALLKNLRELLGSDPKLIEDALLATCKFPDDQNPRTALYLACHHRADLATLKLLVEACPKALLVDNDEFWETVRSKSRGLRLQRRPNLWSCHVNAIECASKSRPSQTDGEAGAAIIQKSWKKICFLEVETYFALLSSKAGAASSRRKNHTACNDSSDRNKYLLHALMNSAGSQQLDYFRRFSSADVVRECAFAKDGRGRIPLHVCLDERKWGHLRPLLEMAPDAAGVPDSKGRYPLHRALRRGGSRFSRRDEVLGLLVDAHKPALAMKGECGLYPFQRAATCDAPLDAIFRMIVARPDLSAIR